MSTIISLSILEERFSLHNIFSLWSLIFASIALVAHLASIGLYRLYFSPIAKFPGPKLAALTTWYQGYYDLWLRGQYFRRIEEMHKKYGPVVRINPHELHFNSPDFVDEIYAGPSKTRDKYKWTPRMLTIRQSTVSTIPHELHRRRRGAMGNYFSKSKIRSLEPMIQEALGKLLARLEICRGSGEVIPLANAFKALTCDIITSYSFGESSDYLDQKDYNAAFFKAIDSLLGFSHWFTHIGWLGPLMETLPNKISASINPGLASLYKMEDQWEHQIQEIRESKDSEPGTKTIFHGVLRSDLPPSEKTTFRLRQEAHLVIVAGTDTTATTLTNITYRLLSNPSILSRLKDELATAIQDPDAPPTCAQVEHLPYLTAIIQEGIRLHPGSVFRMQRVAPNDDLYFKDNDKDWIIPKGTPMSMSARLLQTNPDIFPDPMAFKPERWLENPRLDRYLLAFSKGTRACLGINLAYQELYLVLAGVFRKFDVAGHGAKGPVLALYETGDRDVEMVTDMVVPLVTAESKGVRVVAS